MRVLSVGRQYIPPAIPSNYLIVLIVVFMDANVHKHDVIACEKSHSQTFLPNRYAGKRSGIIQ